MSMNVLTPASLPRGAGLIPGGAVSPRRARPDYFLRRCGKER